MEKTEVEIPKEESAWVTPAGVKPTVSPRDREDDGGAMEEFVSNIVSEEKNSPRSKTSDISADFACLRARCNSKWPIHCYGLFDEGIFNVNAKYGGCAALVQISCAYGGPGADGTAEVALVRCGFDGNHYSWVSLVKNHHGHFGCENTFVTDEDGNLHPDCLFGTNHISVISNHPLHGNNEHGVLVQGSEDGSATVLPLNVNAGRNSYGGTAILVLASGLEPGAGDAKTSTAVYMVRCGFKDNHIKTSVLHGDDKWKFEINGNNMIEVSGLNKSSYAIYHNRGDDEYDYADGKIVAAGKAATFHTASATGKDETEIVTSDKGKFAAVVLCSNGSGPENGTSAAVYLLTVSEGSVTKSLVKGMSVGDEWDFKAKDGKIYATGPSSPTRYGIITNLAAGSVSSCGSLPGAAVCLATGSSSSIQGTATISTEGVKGWVSRQSEIIIKINEEIVASYPGTELKKNGDRFVFNRNYTNEEKRPGLYLIRVFALQNNKMTGKQAETELEGSPQKVIFQPKGVVFAINCGGPAYQALNDIIYTSEFQHVANFDHSYVFGTRNKCLGGRMTCGTKPQMLFNTNDGFMYYSARTSSVEAEDEQKIIYTFPGLPNKSLTMRVHTCSAKVGTVVVNGDDISRKINGELKKFAQIMSGYTGMTAEVPIKIRDGSLQTDMRNTQISAIALLDDSYKEKVTSKEEEQTYLIERQKLIDQIEPINRIMSRKQRKTIGWSQNLIVNCSGEAGDMSHWNYGGDFKVSEGGYGHEKCFATSHMWCMKTQEIDLTENFSPEYLDTAPAIEVFEWYREGCCGGGFYKFEASIMKEDGSVIDSYRSGEIGKIYRNNKWEQERVLFTDYGPGVRRVMLQSSGKDDKYWGGHYGALMSAATVRVKREVRQAEGDSFSDVFDGSDDSAISSKRDRLIAQILADNESLINELTDDQVIPAVDSNFQKQTESVLPAKQKRKKKKREIRVFVSSTFRDFKEEREELIKKTFREVNAACAERGVFFTYVDLRWGITEEQTNTGRTVAICLQEIDRCRPYFICMLGERFGWCQQSEDKPDDLLNQSFDYAIKQDPKSLGWVDEHRFGSSVTKLEVLHGVLNDIEKRKQRSFFYIRDPVRPQDIEPTKIKAMQAESDWHKEQQYVLRDSVQNLSKVLSVKQYKDPIDACGLIKQDLLWCLDQDFPSGTELTMLDKEREAHEAFADARCRVYIGRQEYFLQINEYMQKNERKPLIILGESGSGKSALVANWTSKIEEQYPDAFVFVHFIGSSAESASYIKLLRRLLEEMKKHFRFTIPVPATDANLVRFLPVWLRMAGTFGKCFIIFDALNQLDDGSGQEGNEHDLLWIPKELPSGVSMLLSTLPGRAFDAVESLGWPTMRVSPLNPSEKMEIVVGYMEGIYGKTLADEQKEMIVGAEQTNNPLYLKALLDEVRVYGNFRTLTAKIEEYLGATNPGDLFAKILERLEADFEDDHSRGLVEKTTTAIWCSHKGMSEAELIHLLEAPSAVWSPFYLSLVENLVNRNGILNFFHDHLRQAVENKYLQTSDKKTKGYLALANFFSQQDVDDRVAEELPWLLAKAGELDRLKSTISRLDIFRRMVKSEDGKFDLIKSWTLLGDFNQVEASYKESLGKEPQDEQNTDRYADLQQELASFFIDLGLYGGARSMLEDLLVSLENKYKASHGTIVYGPFDQSRSYMCTHDSVMDLLLNLGTVCQKQKDFDKAKQYYTDVIARQNRINTPGQKLKLCESLLGQATVLISTDDMISAKKNLLRARELATDVLGSRHHYVAAIINKLGQLTFKQDRVDESFGYFLQDLKLTRGDVGTSHLRMGSILNDIALAFDEKNDPIAGELYELALAIFLDTYGPSHLDVALTRYNLGSFYFATNYFARAKYQFAESFKVYETFLGTDHPDSKLAKQALDDVSAFA